jgi:hypothetical protein
MIKTCKEITRFTFNCVNKKPSIIAPRIKFLDPVSVKSPAQPKRPQSTDSQATTTPLVSKFFQDLFGNQMKKNEPTKKQVNMIQNIYIFIKINYSKQFN